MEQKRDNSFDIAKGIAIFLVIWGHVIQQGDPGAAQDNPIFRMIYSVHMPLFVVISGYFFYHSAQKRNFKELIVPKVLNYLKLIVIWNTIHYIFEIILRNKSVFSFTEVCKQWLDELFYGYWFLWAMLFYSIIGALVIEKLQRRYWLVGFVLGTCICIVSPCRWVMITLYPFFVAGIMIAQLNAISFWKEKKCSIMCASIFIAGNAFYYFCDYISNSQVKVVLDAMIQVCINEAEMIALGQEVLKLVGYYALGFTGSIFLINLSDWLAKNRAMKCSVGKILTLLGCESLAIYIMQRIIVEQLYPWSSERLSRVGVGNMTSVSWEGSIATLMLSCLFVIVIYGVVRVIKKFKIGKVLMGNR